MSPAPPMNILRRLRLRLAIPAWDCPPTASLTVGTNGPGLKADLTTDTNGFVEGCPTPMSWERVSYRPLPTGTSEALPSDRSDSQLRVLTKDK